MDPVHKISIVQRGFGALGYTMQLPLEDRYLMQRDDLGRQLAVLLGGRAAEEIALGEISTGAQNDLQRASDIARAMVTEWGMSDALGAVNLAGERRSRFIDAGVPPARGPYSEETARQIDHEVRRIVSEAHGEARRLLTAHRGVLERVTRRLLEREVMDGEELRTLMAEAPASAGVPSASGSRRRRLATIAGLSAASGPMAASAAAKPIRLCVPSQNGLRVEPPHRHSANGRFGNVYSLPFQSTSVTSSPSTSSEPFCRTLIVAMTASIALRPGLTDATRPELPLQ